MVQGETDFEAGLLQPTPSCNASDSSFAPCVLCPAAIDNAQFYADNGVSFVMGTTGGDPAVVAAAAEAAGVYAVVSPQMGKQVRSFCVLGGNR